MSKEHRRFFVEQSIRDIEELTLSGQTVKRFKDVLRLKKGKHLSLFDGSIEREGELSALTGKVATVKFLPDLKPKKAGIIYPRLALGLSLIKNPRMEAVVEKATELGVEAIQLIVSERCVASEISPARLKRLRLIAIQSAEQSGRISVPDIYAPLPFKDALSRKHFPRVPKKSIGSAILSERQGIKISEWAGSNSCYYIFIGPEGGFTDEEEGKAAQRYGFDLVKLTETRLRSETAAISALSFLMLTNQPE